MCLSCFRDTAEDNLPMNQCQFRWNEADVSSSSSSSSYFGQPAYCSETFSTKWGESHGLYLVSPEAAATKFTCRGDLHGAKKVQAAHFCETGCGLVCDECIVKCSDPVKHHLDAQAKAKEEALAKQAAKRAAAQTAAKDAEIAARKATEATEAMAAGPAGTKFIYRSLPGSIMNIYIYIFFP